MSAAIRKETGITQSYANKIPNSKNKTAGLFRHPTVLYKAKFSVNRDLPVSFQKWIFLQLHTYLHTPLRKSMNPIPVRLLLFRIDSFCFSHCLYILLTPVS